MTENNYYCKRIIFIIHLIVLVLGCFFLRRYFFKCERHIHFWSIFALFVILIGLLPVMVYLISTLLNLCFPKFSKPIEFWYPKSWSDRIQLVFAIKNYAGIIYKCTFVMHLLALIITVIIKIAYTLISENDIWSIKITNETTGHPNGSFLDFFNIYYNTSSMVILQMFYCIGHCLIMIYYFKEIEDKYLQNILEDLMTFFKTLWYHNVSFFSITGSFGRLFYMN